MPIYGKLTATELLLVTNAHSVLGCVLNRSPLHGYYQQMFNAHLLCRASANNASPFSMLHRRRIFPQLQAAVLIYFRELSTFHRNCPKLNEFYDYTLKN